MQKTKATTALKITVAISTGVYGSDDDVSITPV